MSVKRNEQTGRYESDSTDFFARRLEEHNANRNQKMVRLLLGEQKQGGQ